MIQLSKRIKNLKNLEDRISELESREKENKQQINQLYENQQKINQRVSSLEEDNRRNNIIKDLTDVSKTGKANYTIKEIADRNNSSEYEVKKIQREEGLSRNKNGKVNKK